MTGRISNMNQFGSDKILKHIERISEWQKCGGSKPITYELDMTNVCNSKCPFCFGYYGQGDKSALTLKEAKRIILQIRDFGGKGLTFTGGGDPLCNKASPEAVRFARLNGLDVGFITNGILLNEYVSELLVDNCTWVRVSLDAGTKETYKLTHGLNGDVFEKLKSNIKKLVEIKKKKKAVATIGSGFLTFPEVVCDMEKFVIVSHGLGVDYAQFRPLLKQSDKNEINKHSDNSLKILENISSAVQKYSNSKFRVLCSTHKYNCLKKNETKRAYHKCYGHNFAAVISADKKMYVCCHMRGLEKYCIGDLSKNSLQEIWKSVKRREVTGSIDFKDCPLLCRCDGFNNILWNIMQQSEHKNFL